MKIKEGTSIALDTTVTEALFDGYIEPKEVLENSEDVEKVAQAIKVLEDFSTSLEDCIEEY